MAIFLCCTDRRDRMACNSGAPSLYRSPAHPPHNHYPTLLASHSAHSAHSARSARRYYRDSETGAELEAISKEPLVEGMAENYKQYGCNLQFITDKSAEGVQFVKGFGGVGGDLRWKVDFQEMNFGENEGAAADDDDNSDSDSAAGSDGYGFGDDDFGF